VLLPYRHDRYVGESSIQQWQAEDDGIRENADNELELRAESHQGKEQDGSSIEEQKEEEWIVDIGNFSSIDDMPSFSDQDQSSEVEVEIEVEEEGRHNAAPASLAEEILKAEAEIEEMRMADQKRRSPTLLCNMLNITGTYSTDSEAAEEARLMAYDVIGEEARQLEEHLRQINVANSSVGGYLLQKDENDAQEAAPETETSVIDQEAADVIIAEEEEHQRNMKEGKDYKKQRRGSLCAFSESLKLPEAEEERTAESFRRASIEPQKRNKFTATKCEDLPRDEAQQNEQSRLRIIRREAQEEALQRNDVVACILAEEARLDNIRVCAHKDEAMLMVEAPPRVTNAFCESFESQNRHLLQQSDMIGTAQADRTLYRIPEPEIKPQILNNDPNKNMSSIMSNKNRVSNDNRPKKTVAIKERHRKSSEQPKKLVELEAAIKENESDDAEGRQKGERGNGRQDKRARMNASAKTSKAHAPSSPTSTRMPPPNANSTQQRFELFYIKYENTFLDQLTATLVDTSCVGSACA
jgi:hypothetical protein